jgi:hypothetical protein
VIGDTCDILYRCPYTNARPSGTLTRTLRSASRVIVVITVVEADESPARRN